ncbi:MAG: 50S ribosomal protein L7/L12 [Erysipelotrichales bacterium]|jgi:large subunit ribosomal protein L7/L12|nr:50S ribosomal protein L7/L12 [Erysipelotrichales bacterium]MBQ1386698.1 50S ribosomal protein L7/L12 [Erysipelotrichales bacterium]MBQ2310701.1 50S ribosomal protein L7/L12 [Erysipelotrichales bacterium]MBQ4374589.1 50S ribosomal protein L7/L12 [Erysipelotrichales bacterium]MBQ5541579.1 50S ribosomal protein L7/L12 [Erysipelotrichales bacterium]
MAITKQDIIEFLEGATILEINEVVKAIEEHFGVSAAAPVAGPAVAAEEGPAEVTEVSVFLKEIGQAKIAVIKAVKEATGLGLVDAKKIVDAVANGPAAIKEKIKPEEADTIKKTIEAAGAVVEIK